MELRGPIVCLTLLLGATTAGAATFTVTSLADNTIPDAQLTLREAILMANADPGLDEIVFATGPGTVTLGGTALPALTQPVAIRGPGAAHLAIDGAQSSRVFEVAPGATVTLSGLTLRGGRAQPGNGGGILNSGGLTITDCVFSSNRAEGNGGALWNEGLLVLAGSTLVDNSAQNGGGVYNAGFLEVSDSTFAANFTGGIAPFAGGGGGLLNVGTAAIESSTFASNLANNGGGVVSNGTLTVENVTFVGNTALRNGGGLSAPFGEVVVSASTLAGNAADVNDAGVGNGGGLSAVSSLVLLERSIVAENLRGPIALEDVSAAVDPSSADNLIGVNTGLTGISHGSNGNQIGTAGSPIDPFLGALQNNGGRTLTRALLPGSPARDAGSAATCPAEDQRGIARPLDGDGDTVAECDVGAYEAFSVAAASASFFTVLPCRVADTRLPAAPSGGPPLEGNTSRFFPVAGLCGIPADARAVALNVTVVGGTDVGNLRLYPAGNAAPIASTINFVAGVARANNALAPLGAGGRIAVQCDMPSGSAATAHVVLDVYGYLR